jgi:hypothetical protein
MYVVYVCTFNLFSQRDLKLSYQTEVVMQNSRNRAKRLAASLKELADLGSTVDLSAADIEDEATDILIEQGGGIVESRIFELPSGLIGYMIYVAITNLRSRPIYVRDVELRDLWQDDLFYWMADPRETRKLDSYRFPGKGSPELPREQVLNHFLFDGEAFTPKRSREGWLLATGRPMPESLRDRQGLDATLAILTATGAEYTQGIHLCVERLAVKPKFAATRNSNLFEKPVEQHLASSHLSPSVAGFRHVKIGGSTPGSEPTGQFTT